MMQPHDAESVALWPALVVDPGVAGQRRMLGLLERLGPPPGALHACASMLEARAACREIPFRLALVDIQLPDGNGLALVDWMRNTHPHITALAVSASGGEDSIVTAVRCGAQGYLLTDRDDAELLAALRSIARGGAPIDPSIARHLLQLLGGPPPRTPGHAGPRDGEAEALTLRELEVLGWVAQGLISRDIAHRMDRSPQTIESHIKNIFRKMGVNTRTEAVHRARLRGLLG
jgi:DNA-binding NarL/FixJ family response regulator